MITSDFVEQACAEVNALTDSDIMAEFDRFFTEQPSICDFIMELTSESSTKIQELSFFLSYVVYKAVGLGPRAVAEVQPDLIESAFHESERWIEQINRHELPEEVPGELEPHLVAYVIAELNEPLEDGTILEDEQKGEVFFLLKTVISCLTRSSLGKETE